MTKTTDGGRLGPRPCPPSFTLNVHAAPDSVQAAFLRRAMSALERIVGSASAKSLTDALAASTDVGSLARLLSRSDVVGSAVVDLDPLAPMLARNVEHRQKLLQLAGGALSAEGGRPHIGDHASGCRQTTAREHLARRSRGKRLALSRLPVPPGRNSSRNCRRRAGLRKCGTMGRARLLAGFRHSARGRHAVAGPSRAARDGRDGAGEGVRHRTWLGIAVEVLPHSVHRHRDADQSFSDRVAFDIVGSGQFGVLYVGLALAPSPRRFCGIRIG